MKQEYFRYVSELLWEIFSLFSILEIYKVYTEASFSIFVKTVMLLQLLFLG